MDELVEKIERLEAEKQFLLSLLNDCYDRLRLVGMNDKYSLMRRLKETLGKVKR